jgi:citrate lyase subunit beta / citryl-CoA lyase
MRSTLYVPGDQPEKMAKALHSGADALILDLEDAVAPSSKDAARAAVCAFLTARPSDQASEAPLLWVRINQGQLGRDDAVAVVRAGGTNLAGFYVPKTDSLADLDALDAEVTQAEAAAGLAVGSILFCALIETATGVLRAAELAQHHRVTHLAIGEADLSSELGVELTPDDEREMLFARSMLVLSASAARINPPIGPVSTNFRDLEAYRERTVALKRLGFSGRSAIHPAQVPVINEVFAPSADELASARRLVELFDLSVAEGRGVCVDDRGKMVDEAVVRAARRTLLRATQAT